MDQPLKKIVLRISGMHCASCELLIEDAFKGIPGVSKVSVSFGAERARVYAASEVPLSEFQRAVADHGYKVSLWRDSSQNPSLSCDVPGRNTKKDYFEIGAVFLIIVGLYVIFKQFNLLPSIGISENMSYGFVFLIGLVAATSTCIAVTGGLLVSVAAKYNEAHPDLSGIQKFKPHLYFNIGRVISYTILGGFVGALGRVLTLSPRVNGIVTIAASFIMLLLGFQLLNLFPGLRKFMPKMPKFLAHRISDVSGHGGKMTASFLGACTFFLPCGFTQALQLYVLSKGDFMTGALTMFFFSLGTLPALVSLSVLSSFVKGAFQRYFVKSAGVVVILLGVFNINNGLALAGNGFTFTSLFQQEDSFSASALDPNVQIIDGKQVVKMKVRGLSYSPSTFTVQQGIPVEWQIDGAGAEGCGQIITVPSLGITRYLSQKGITKITFTPEEVGKIPFHCTMGMTTRGASFTVVAGKGVSQNEPAQKAAIPESVPASAQKESAAACNPQFANCI